MTRMRTMTIAMTSRMWMKPPIVYDVTMPRSHRTRRMTKMVIPAIVDGVIGLTAGESRSFETTLPQDYRQEELRGATVTIDVTVHAVRERILPPEDDALAVLDQHGPTLEDLREHYRGALAVEAAEQDRERHEGAALEALRDYVRVDVPETMIEREIERQLADLEYRLASLGLPLDRYIELG